MRKQLVCLLALTAACAGESDPGPLGPVFAVSGDYQDTGIATTVSLPSLSVTRNSIAGVASSDPIVRHDASRIFIVNRFGADNISIIDKGTGMLLDQISTGAGSNPQDVVARGDLLYVAALGAAGILVLDTTRPGDGVVDMIDLSGIRVNPMDPALDPDGMPNCASVALVGDLLFAACGLLDDADQFLSPRGPGAVSVIDLANDSEVTTMLLGSARPFGLFQPFEGDLLLTTVPDFGDLSMGCLERISGDGSGRSCLVENAALGGFAASYHESNGELAVAVTTGYDDTDFGPLGGVVSVADGMVGAPMTPAAHRAFDMARCPDGHLVVSNAMSGLRVYSPDGEELTDTPLDIGLPPVQNGLICF